MNWTETNARSYPRRLPSLGPLAPRERPAWMDRGACRGRTEMFFPGEHNRVEVLEAKAICAGCPVSSECLAYAITYNEIDGVWGQTSGEERKKMRRQQRASS